MRLLVLTFTHPKLGDITPTSDFNYVKDTVRVFLAIAECDATIGKEINIASNYVISMADMMNIIKDIMKSDVQFITDDVRLRPENSEVFRLWGDNNLITSLTGRLPKYPIDQGLKETISWQKIPENLKKYKAGIYNL